jgi:hypothetical protein
VRGTDERVGRSEPGLLEVASYLAPASPLLPPFALGPCPLLGLPEISQYHFLSFRSEAEANLPARRPTCQRVPLQPESNCPVSWPLSGSRPADGLRQLNRFSQ